MNMNFLREDGTVNLADGNASVWLPAWHQMRDALQFQVGDAVGPEIEEEAEVILGKHTTMQQGMGLIIAIGVVSGSLPFLFNLIRATAAGTSLQMLTVAEFAMQRTQLWSLLGLDATLMSETFQNIAGMSPRAPGFIAALFSALGVWVNTPLSLLTLWIAYGAGVLTCAHFVGAKSTLQRFFSTTAYAFLPLTLGILAPIPGLGWLAALFALLGFVLLYIRSVSFVTGLDGVRSLICVLLPGTIFFSLWAIAAGMWLGAYIMG